MATLNDMDRLAKNYADWRAKLCAQVTELELEIEQARRTHLPEIKRIVAGAAGAKAHLAAAVEETPEQFVKPRTVVMHGIKVGFQKGKGKIEFDDPEKVVKLIRKHYPEQFDLLVKTTEKPVKKALGALTAEDLKKLGITVESTGDVVIIEAADSEVDKLVAALLKEDTQEQGDN